MGVHRRSRWSTAVVWFRRDLRVHDHPALSDAVANARQVVPLFVLDSVLLEGSRPAPNRVGFMLESVAELRDALRERGVELCVLRGRPDEVVPRFASLVSADAVLVSRDASPYGRRRDAAVAAALDLDGRSFEDREGDLLFEPEEVRTRDGRGFGVFSPFWRAASTKPLRTPLPAPNSIPDGGPRTIAGDLAGILDTTPPGSASPGRVAGGEIAARQRLRDFIAGALATYEDDRNRLDRDGTSRLSQDLRFGLVSAVEVATVVERAAQADPRIRSHADAFLRQLGWRDFYHHLLRERPELLRQLCQDRYADVAYRDPTSDPDAAADLHAWQNGETGYPVVDAAMRQLRSTGWMHNRGRLIVASFLTRHLLISHAHGERDFMAWLTDGDVASNNGGWRWTAGVGADAQPWFRVLNPLLQGRRFDPNGDFVRRWVPELRTVGGPAVHEPWLLGRDALARAGVTLGESYPERIVDLSFGRQRALDAFRATQHKRQA